MPPPIRIVLDTISRYVRDTRGNFAILFAFAIFALTLIIGLSIDFFTGTSIKARFDAASDAAALAAVNTANAYVKSNSTTQAGSDLYDAAITLGAAQAVRAFNANLGIAASATSAAVKPSVTLTKQSVTNNGQVTNSFNATVSYAAQIKTAFGPLVGVKQFGLQGSASATAQFPQYMDIYFLIDASGSMGIGATDTDQATMLSKVGCTVGCHSPWNGQGKFWPDGTYPNVRAISPPVTMRIDVVRQAVIKELKIIQSNTFNGQIRVAIYLFSNGIQRIYDLSSDIGGAITASANIDIIGAAGQGGTYATYSLGQFANLLPSVGDGSSSTSRSGSVLLFTDGIQDDASPKADGSEISSCAIAPNYVGFPPTSNCEFNIQGFNHNDCAPIKTRGYKLYTLDFIYYITAATMASDARYKFIGQTLNPSVKANMAACATSSSNATYAMTPDDFVKALDALITQVLADVRITK